MLNLVMLLCLPPVHIHVQVFKMIIYPPHTHTHPRTHTHIHIHIGVDDLLAQHVAHLFIRDSISLFAEKLEQSVENESDHFEVSISCPHSHMSATLKSHSALGDRVLIFRGLNGIFQGM